MQIADIVSEREREGLSTRKSVPNRLQSAEIELAPHLQRAYTHGRRERSHVGIAEQIKTARKARNWSLRELAKACGLSYQFLWDVETGRRTPSLGALQRIADALGIAFSFGQGSANSRRTDRAAACQ